MKERDIENVQMLYDKYNKLLFKDKLPHSNEIEFCLDSYDFCVGYTEYKRDSSIDEPKYKIAFSSIFKIPEKTYTETLIHEMIHIWQMNNLSKDRYTICTHTIAHDRNFLCKMRTINLMLEREGYDLEITEVYNGPDLLKDKSFKGTVKTINDLPKYDGEERNN